ncbi:Phloem filament protein [Cucumis melo var. makuwa]|uniref:Phloem filament protein n=2 Tax=Cucumis melo TaxID=3656 RepID=A0A5A7TIS8_CUCMM|nr:Phloem filament protein [Cucumis melo var. makuwa]TYK21340.1 Phloem filament protein [Cucumis melo var. makuwa]
MSCLEKGEWIKIPDVSTPCVHDIATFAVNQHNNESGEKLTLKSVVKGWFLELSYDRLKHRLILTATNDKGVVKTYEAIVCVIEKSGFQRVRKLLSFNAGYLDENGDLFWIEILDINQPCVQDVAKAAVAQHNEKEHDSLVYISITQGWYRELDVNYAILFNIHLITKDCFGRVREFKALVLEDKHGKDKIRTLKSFEVIKKC